MALDKPLRDLGMKSERLLWPTKGPGHFETEVQDLESKVGLSTLGKAVAWAHTKSMWPDTFGLACCAMEMMAIVSSRYDIARFGMEAFRSSPRQADLLIVSGRVSHKMAAPLRQIYDQMLEPKWVIAMGACAQLRRACSTTTRSSSRSTRSSPSTSTCPGCPPRPEQLMEGIIRLHEAVQAGVPPAYELPDESPHELRARCPGSSRTKEAHGETTLVVDPARLRRGLHATCATRRASTSSRTSPPPTTSAGASAGVSGYIGTAGRPRPEHADDAGSPGHARSRSRSASR